MGRRQIWDESVDEYLGYLNELEKHGHASYIVVDENDEEEWLDTWDEAVAYAKKVGAEEIIVDGFEYCWGDYDEGEYVEYGQVTMDLDGNIIDWE